jgi:hypothetical protein
MRSIARSMHAEMIVLSFLILLGPVRPARGQVSKGSVSGTVVDIQEHAVSGAAIRLVNQQTNDELSTVSGTEGIFRLNLLPVGLYHLEITKEGFRKAVIDNVEVHSGADYGLGEIHLAVGSVDITVEVTSSAPLLESSAAQITNSLDSQTLAAQPSILANEGLDNLALLIPGVAPTRDLTAANTNGAGFAVNGIRGRHNDEQIDGQNNNSSLLGGPQISLGDAEFVQEYQLVTGNFDAEYGRNSGSVVNIITKSGTNTFHGSAYVTDTNSRFTTLSNVQKRFLNLTSPPHFNDVFSGGTIGGPVVKDRLFFFGGFDSDILSQITIATTGPANANDAPWTPTAAGLATLAACFPNSTSVQALSHFGPWGIKGGTLSQVGSPVSETVSGCPTPVEFSGVERSFPSPVHSYNWMGKLDYQTGKDHLYGRYLYNKSNQIDTDTAGTGVSGYPVTVSFLGQDFGFSWTRLLALAMANELRANYGHTYSQTGGNSFGSFPNAIQADNSVAFVNLFLAAPINFLPFGPPFNVPNSVIENTFQFQDNWNYLRGRHALKGGVNFSYLKAPYVFLPAVNGIYGFGSFSNFVRNRPARIRIAKGDPHHGFTEADTFTYFGDDFKVRSNLTLNLGLTWSYYGQPANVYNGLTTQRESNSATAFWLSSLPLDVRTSPRYPSQKSWAPGVGFAYTPAAWKRIFGNGKTVFRGGYRLAYDPAFYNLYIDLAVSAPVSFLTVIPRPSSFGYPLPADIHGSSVRSVLAPALGVGTLDPRTFAQTRMAPKLGPQQVHEWSFGVQREVASNAVVEARYIGNHGTNLFQSINGNPRIDGLAAGFPNLIPAGVTPCPASQAFDPVAAGRVDCSAGLFREWTNSGYSSYHGLQAEFRASQLWRQLTIRTGYTWSKTTDNTSDLFATLAAGASNAYSQNPLNNTRAEHGVSGLDFPHNWTMNFVEEIPVFGSQKGLAGHLLGGWSFSGEYHIISGQAFTPSQAALNCNSSACDPAQSFYDLGFNNTFVGQNPDGALRPYLGNPLAPANSVGIFAGDACTIYMDPNTGAGPGCTLPASQLISLNVINGSTISGTPPPEVLVTNKQVRFVANTPIANQFFGTPFGNVSRNSLRDARTNIANFALFKRIRLNERVNATFRMSMQNVFNHPNFASVDPFIDHAGQSLLGTGFADPSLTSGGNRTVRFGVMVRF